jgi:hypothetical protein
MRGGGREKPVINDEGEVARAGCGGIKASITNF